MKWIQTIASIFASITIVLSPVAQGAAAENSNRETVKQFLKITQLGSQQKMTVAEFYKRWREWYPEPLKAQLDTWVKANGNQLMPQVDVTTFKDSEGVEQVRLTLHRDGKSLSLSTQGWDEKSIKVGSRLTVDANTYYNVNTFATQVKREYGGGTFLSKTELRKLNPAQLVSYVIELRKLTEEMEKTQNELLANSDTKTSQIDRPFDIWSKLLVGEFAQASSCDNSTSCIFAGYTSHYENLGGDCKCRQPSNTSCSGGGVTCNPVIYGNTCALPSKTQGLRYATNLCGDSARIKTDQDKKDFVKKYLKDQAGIDIQSAQVIDGKVVIKLSKDDLSKDANLADKIAKQSEALNAELNQLSETCAKIGSPIKKGKVLDDQKGHKQNLDACSQLENRRIAFEANVEKIAVPAPVVTSPCSATPVDGVAANSNSNSTNSNSNSSVGNTANSSQNSASNNANASNSSNADNSSQPAAAGAAAGGAAVGASSNSGNSNKTSQSRRSSSQGSNSAGSSSQNSSGTSLLGGDQKTEKPAACVQASSVVEPEKATDKPETTTAAKPTTSNCVEYIPGHPNCTPVANDDSKKGGGFFGWMKDNSNWIIPLGIFAGAFLFLRWMTKDTQKSYANQATYPIPPATPMGFPTSSTIILPPPPPPPIVNPAPMKIEGGSGTSTIVPGGVR